MYLCPAERNGKPLQYSCPENPMDRGPWWATAQGVAKSWTQLSHQYIHTYTHTHTMYLWVFKILCRRMLCIMQISFFLLFLSKDYFFHSFSKLAIRVITVKSRKACPVFVKKRIPQTQNYVHAPHWQYSIFSNWWGPSSYHTSIRVYPWCSPGFLTLFGKASIISLNLFPYL